MISRNILCILGLVLLVGCTTTANQKAAEADLAKGYSYLKGTSDVQKDAAKAVELFMSAAKKGSSDAAYNVGLAYVRGEGVAKDFSQAYTWFEKAAYKDDAGAQYNLGVMAINGEGRVADPLAAYVWFKLAAEKGYEGAEEGRETAKNNMTQDQLKEIDRAYAEVSRKIKKPAQASAGANVPL